MSTLNEIVLPLKECIALKEKGIKIDTVYSWTTDTFGGAVLKQSNDIADDDILIAPAPTLEEMLRKIWHTGKKFSVHVDELAIVEIKMGSEQSDAHDLDFKLAAFAMLMEVK